MTRGILRYALAAALAASVSMTPLSSMGAVLYKDYLVKYDKGRDLLCDLYKVKPDDWISKLFIRKGEIAHRDYQEFLRIFKRINPHIRDVDRIRPGQRILIPLRELASDSLPGQKTGMVTIPFATISGSDPAKTSEPHRRRYRIRPGDTVSKLISARFGPLGSENFRRAMERFQRLNPAVSDLDRIYAGQTVILPSAEKPAYAGLKPVASLPSLPPPPAEDRRSLQVLSELAHALGARLISRGIYFFPAAGGTELRIDLSRTPVLELPDGARLVLMGKNAADGFPWDAVRRFWRRAVKVELPTSPTPRDVFHGVMSALSEGKNIDRLSFADRGIKLSIRGDWILQLASGEKDEVRQVCISAIDRAEQRTSEAVIRYLERRDVIVRDFLLESDNDDMLSAERIHESDAAASDAAILAPPASNDFKTTVLALLSALGYPSSRDVRISFPYAGTHVSAVANLVSRKDGNPVFVDFGDLKGDAAAALRRSGFNLVQLQGDKDLPSALRDLSHGLGFSCKKNPVLQAAMRDASRSVSLKLNGILITDGDRKTFIAPAPFPESLEGFLSERNIRVFLLEEI